VHRRRQEVAHSRTAPLRPSLPGQGSGRYLRAALSVFDQRPHLLCHGLAYKRPQVNRYQTARDLPSYSANDQAVEHFDFFVRAIYKLECSRACASVAVPSEDS